jgi:DNA-binding NarL/FixJ family response regulator
MTIPPPIRIILVDDHQLMRESWKMILEHNPRFEVIADCENGLSAIEQAGKLRPEIMLIDINMSPMNGFDVTENILKKYPDIKVIGMSVNNQPVYAIRMMKSGAWGYLTKTSSTDEITDGILQVYEGRKYICNEIKKNMPPEESAGIV